jgi:hypothetical protein
MTFFVLLRLEPCLLRPPLLLVLLSVFIAAELLLLLPLTLLLAIALELGDGLPNAANTPLCN